MLQSNCALWREGLRVAEISARRKISAHGSCGSEEHLVDWGFPILVRSENCVAGFLLSTGAVPSGLAGRQDGVSRHVGCFRGRSRGYIRARSR